MTATLVLTSEIAAELLRATTLAVESAGVLIVGIATAPDGDLRMLGQALRWVPEESYVLRDPDELKITSDGYMSTLGEAEMRAAACIWFHTHPGRDGVPISSALDDHVDSQLAEVFRLRTGSPYYGSAIFSSNGSHLSFTGLIETPEQRFAIRRLVETGDRFRLTDSYNTPGSTLPAIYDRQVRAFGAEVQQTLGHLRVAVVGCGGTGSAVCEQLVRLGVRDILLIDPDIVTESNLTRLYGSRASDVGQAKVNVVRRHLTDIAPSIRCRVIQGSITTLETAKHLVDCDIVYGCTDDNAGRLVLSRLATYLMTLVIDCGVLLSSDADGELTGIDGRVTVLSPNSACLLCRGRIDLRRAAAELLAPEEQRRLESEGYAPALGRVEPAVVAYTTAVAAAAINELLERLVGFGRDARPSEVLLRIHDREISTNSALPRQGHYCDPAANRQGRGMTEPFLEQVWAQ
jgi:molybdopterin/thiamine biosynthesis adenylyltransferase